MKATILLLLLIPYLSFATIVSGNISPMQIDNVTNPQTTYDFDNNGQYDLMITVKFSQGGASGSSWYLILNGLNGAKIETDGNLNAIGYNSGTMLGVNTYQDSGYVKGTYFPQMVTKYVGLKFKINGNYCCCYFGVNPNDYFQGLFLLTTFGYDNNSSVCITAGQATGISDLNNQAKIVSVYPNPFSNSATFEFIFSNSFSDISLLIYNVYGQKVRVINHISSGKILFDKGDLVKGIYFYEVQDKNDKIALGRFVVD